MLLYVGVTCLLPGAILIYLPLTDSIKTQMTSYIYDKLVGIFLLKRILIYRKAPKQRKQTRRILNRKRKNDREKKREEK